MKSQSLFGTSSPPPATKADRVAAAGGAAGAEATGAEAAAGAGARDGRLEVVGRLPIEIEKRV